MFTPSMILNSVSDAILNRPVSVQHRFCIIWHESRFKCLPFGTCPREAPCFGVFSDDVLRGGLSAVEWDLIARKAVNFFERDMR